MSTPVAPNRRGREDRGAVLVLVCILLPVLLIMTAFAVDLGRQRSSRRTMQARADIVALDLARLADGRLEAKIEQGDASHDPASVVLANSAAKNNIDPARITVDWGTWDGEEFVSDAIPPDAVRVTAVDPDVDYYFAPGSGKTSRSAVASNGVAAGCFSIGSFAAGLNSGSTVLNKLLGGFVGSSPQLQAIGYSGLAAANVNLLDLAAQLGVGSPEEVLNTTVTRGQFYAAVANALPNDGSGAVKAALLQAISASGNLNQPIKVADVISIDPGAEGAAATAEMNVLDLLATGAALSNGANALSLGDFGINVPGVSLSMTSSIVEALRSHCGPINDVKGTSQIQLDITGTLSVNAQQLRTALQGVRNVVGPALDPVLNLLTGIVNLLTNVTCAVLHIGCPAQPLVEVKIKVRGASAEAWLASVVCVGDERTGHLRANTGLATIDVDVKVNGTAIPKVFQLGFDGVEEGIDVYVPPELPQSEEFGRNDLSLSPAKATVLGNALASLVLTRIIDPLQANLLTPLLQQLGLDLAGGDLILRSMTCAGIKLVD